jgi:hypothetical protein
MGDLNTELRPFTSVGPKVPVGWMTEFEWAVRKDYGGTVTATVTWRGMLTLFYKGQPLMDVEIQVVDSQRGRFASLPQRAYADPSGVTRYKRLMWLYSAEMRDVMLEAVDQHLSRRSG